MKQVENPQGGSLTAHSHTFSFGRKQGGFLPLACETLQLSFG
jgi:hypothetical protein